MVVPLGRLSGRKSSQVSKICLIMWTWKIVVSTMLGNTKISRVVTSVSHWIFMRFECLREVWRYEQDGNQIFRVKSRIGGIRKGVGNRSGSQDQSKAEKTQNSKVCHQKCQYEGPFQQNQRVWKIVKVPYLKRIPKHEPTLSYFHLVVCLRECMMRCGENNHHVHNGYEK